MTGGSVCRTPVRLSHQRLPSQREHTKGGPAVPDQIRPAVASGPQSPSAFRLSPRFAGGDVTE